METAKYCEVSAERESAIARLNKRLRKMSQSDRVKIRDYANKLCDTTHECFNLLTAAMSDQKFSKLEEFVSQVARSDRE